METEHPIPYDVVHCTSQDDEYPITELAHGSLPPVATAGGPPVSLAGVTGSSRGWQSAENAKMPQSLVLRFPGNVMLTKIRIVSHEYKIASSVEVRLFALGDKKMEKNPPSFSDISYVKLGVVELSNNKHSNYRSKERKTIHLQAEAYFLNFLLGTPHHNELNRFSQVGIYSIECIGWILSRVRRHFNPEMASNEITSRVSNSDLLPDADMNSSHGQQQHHQQQRRRDGSTSPFLLTPLRGVPRRSSHVTEVPVFRSVRILQFEDFFIHRSAELLALKDQAAAMEDFEIAKQCRDRINLINQRSKYIYQLEQKKVQAIIEEEFDAAKEAKRAMDAMIEKVYEDAQMPRPRPDFDPYRSVEDVKNENTSCGNPQHATVTAQAGPEGVSRPRHSKLMKRPKHSQRHDSSEHDDDDDGHDDSPNSGSYCNAGERDNADGDEGGVGKQVAIANCYRGGGGDNSSNNNNNTCGVGVSRGSGGPGSSADAKKSAHALVGNIDDRINVPLEKDNSADDGDGGSAALPLIEEAQLQPWERQVFRAIMMESGEVDGPVLIDPDLRNTREALDLTAATGTFTAASLYSRRFKLRESALNVLTENISLYRLQPAVIEEAVLRFLDTHAHGLQDAVPNVVSAGCGFLRMVLADEHNCLSDVIPPVLNLLPRLLCCAANSNARIREEAFAILALFVKTPLVPKTAIFGALLADPIDRERRRLSSTSPRVQVARLTLLEELLTAGSVGFRNIIKNLWERLLQPCVNHQNREVRDLAVSVITRLLEMGKLTLTAGRARGIENVGIRGQLKAVAAQAKSPRACSSSSSTAVADAGGPNGRKDGVKKTCAPRHRPTARGRKAW